MKVKELFEKKFNKTHFLTSTNYFMSNKEDEIFLYFVAINLQELCSAMKAVK